MIEEMESKNPFWFFEYFNIFHYSVFATIWSDVVCYSESLYRVGQKYYPTYFF